MKFFSMLLILFVLVSACAKEEVQEEAKQSHATAVDKEALQKADPTGTYGEGVQLTEPVAIAAILKDPQAYEGKTVLIQGKVTDVCPNMGCWVDVAENDQSQPIRVKVEDGVIVFPLSAKGHTGMFEGVVEKMELTEEQAREWKAHEAEERGEEFDPATVTGPLTIWRIKGKGAKIES